MGTKNKLEAKKKLVWVRVSVRDICAAILADIGNVLPFEPHENDVITAE